MILVDSVNVLLSLNQLANHDVGTADDPRHGFLAGHRMSKFSTSVAFCLFVASGFPCLGTGLVQAAESGSTRPNLVVILLDNVGKDWFRCYGSQENQTPNMDRICYSGLKFRNFYVTPVCSTTRTMLLTGRYPFRTGWHTHHDTAIYGGGYLDWNREVTFARVLRDAGYATAISGKWQINDLFDPEQQDALAKHGFQEHCIWPEAPPGHPAHKKRYWDAYIFRDRERIDTTGKFGPDVFTDYSIDFMRRHRDRPFLLYHSAILTHIPVTTTPTSPNASASPREQFAGMVGYADHLVGRLVGALDDLGIRDNTVVMIATDNGTDNGTDQGMQESLGGQIGGVRSGEGIYSLTERGINTPLIVVSPWIAGGAESDALLNAADVLPTLLDLAGAKPPRGVSIDGKSFAPMIRGQGDQRFSRDWTFTQYADVRVLRDQRFKMYSSGAFYDLAADPLERHDLAFSDDPSLAVGRRRLQEVFNGLPANAPWPWTFRSISARKMRIAADRPRRLRWTLADHPPPELLRASFQRQASNDTSQETGAEQDAAEAASRWDRDRRQAQALWRGRLSLPAESFAQMSVEAGSIARHGTITERQLSLQLVGNKQPIAVSMWIPDGDGPFPAVVICGANASATGDTSDDGNELPLQCGRRGFVALMIDESARRGKESGDLLDRVVRDGRAALAAQQFLMRRPEVYPDRIGILGFGAGSPGARLAACLSDEFACASWSDSGPLSMERSQDNDELQHRTVLPGVAELQSLLAPRPVLITSLPTGRESVWSTLQELRTRNQSLRFRYRVAVVAQAEPTIPTWNDTSDRFFGWWLQERD